MKKLIDKWLFSFNGGDTQFVTIPHDWAVARPFNKDMDCGCEQGFFDRWGVGEYSTVVSIDKQSGERYILEFDGVYENCILYVNEKLIGQHKYGYSCFSFDVTNSIKDGDNSLRAIVDNTTRPVDRWYSGCGIYRNVYLKCVPDTYIDRNNVIIKSSTDGIIDIETGIEAAVSAEIVIGEKTYRSNGVGHITVNADGFESWTAENPALYQLVLTDEENGYHEKFNIGFRDIQFTNKGFFINGVHCKLKGACVHQDVSCFGSAAPKDIWRKRFQVFKEYGINALRLAHHLFMPEVLDLCDEMGFYVYEECFDKWQSGLYERYYTQCWQQDIAAMVKRDRNRPSIIIWGVGNEVENQTSEDSLDCLSKHCSYLKSMDKTRPVTFAVFPWFWRDCDITDNEAKATLPIYGEDPADIAYRIKCIRRMCESVDIIACNYQEPWYENYHHAFPDMPILGTEIYQFFRGYPQKLNSYDDTIPWLDAERNDYVIGGFVWSGIDYLGESMGWPAKGWTGSLFAADMEPKAGAYILRSFWDDKPFVHFAVLDYSVGDEFAKEQWDMPIYVSHWDFPDVHKAVVPFMVASNCDEIQVTLNDKPMLRKKPADYKNRMVTGFLPYARGTVEVTGFIDGVQVCSYCITTSNKAARLEFDKIQPSKEGVYMLKVRVKDEKGNVCFRENSQVNFTISDDGEIIGIENGDALCLVPYNSHSVPLYRGRAGVAVRVHGDATVTASADGLESTCVVF